MTSPAIVSLTYDDGLPVHRERVAPGLSRRGLSGTFYVPAAGTDLHAHRDGWRALAEAGHELGNHTCFHPCRGGPARAWVDAAYDLRTYSEKRFADEMALADAILRGIDGRTVRSFAATCGDLDIGPDDLKHSVEHVALRHACCIRNGSTTTHLPGASRPGIRVPHFRGDGQTAATVIAAIDAAVAAGGWLVVLFHGVGQGTHNHFIAADEHERIIDHLAALGGRVRGMPFVEAWLAQGGQVAQAPSGAAQR
jgi:sialate O-acetylesterase